LRVNWKDKFTNQPAEELKNDDDISEISEDGKIIKPKLPAIQAI
jgi:hypothetical protein